MTTAHTATPWRFEDGDSNSPHITADIAANAEMRWNNPVICNLYEDVTPDDSVTIGAWLEPFRNAHANGEFIVRACNAYDKDQETIAALVAALQTARNGLVWYMEETEQANECDNEALAQIDAALAKGGAQ